MAIRKQWIFSVVVATVLGSSASVADVMVDDDVWDVSQGASVTAHSPLIYNSAAADMFGDRHVGNIEAGNTLFSDSYDPGYIHWVEWQTPDPVTIRRFNLVAAHEDPYTRRSFNHFTLYAWSGSEWVQLYDEDIPIPYGGGPNYTAITMLELNEPVTNVMAAQQFRAEFTQHGDVSAAKGPRIMELDGLLIPEPAGFCLLAGGLLIALRRRRFA